MYTAIVSFVLSIIGWGTSLLKYFNNKQLIDGGKAQAIVDSLQGQLDSLREALVAREKVREELIKKPEKIDEDDGYRRD